MSIKAITPSLNKVQLKQNNCADNNKQNSANSNPSFGNAAVQGVVQVMDWIEKGGFITGFIIQDGLGMVIPRVATGVMRGKGSIDPKTGEERGYNWEFARREGLREVLSGPSAYLVPCAMIAGIKKFGGSANNVPVDLINSYGEEFKQFTKNNIDKLDNPAQTKPEFYKNIFKNILAASTDGSLPAEEIDKKAASYASKIIEIEDTKGSKVKKVLINELTEDINAVRKKYNSAFVNETTLSISNSGKKVTHSVERFIKSLPEYTDDALKYTKKHLTETVPDAAEDVISKFNLNRTGSRVITNLSMWGAVAAAMMLIPKIYNLGLKHDPGLVGTAAETHIENETPASNITANANTDEKTANALKPEGNKQVAFQGISSMAGKLVNQKDSVGKILKHFEFEDAAMGANAMAAVLFGFCLPPRYVNAKSNFERAEILFRDIASFTAILFGAKALSRGFSQIFTKTSGIPLYTQDAQFEKRSIPGKIWQYFSANSDISSLNSTQLEMKYSNMEGFKNGITDMVDFVEGNKGNIKKVLSIDTNILKNVEKLLGKSIKEASVDEIKTALKNGAATTEMKNIYNALKHVNGNKILGRAKALNSIFGALSTFLLVPTFMIWLSEHCKKMTMNRAKRLAEEKAAMQPAPIPVTNNITSSNTPSMQGFLNKL